MLKGNQHWFDQPLLADPQRQNCLWCLPSQLSRSVWKPVQVGFATCPVSRSVWQPVQVSIATCPDQYGNLSRSVWQPVQVSMATCPGQYGKLSRSVWKPVQVGFATCPGQYGNLSRSVWKPVQVGFATYCIQVGLANYWVGWSDFKRKLVTLHKLCQIVVGPQFQNFNDKCCLFTWRRA